MSQTPTMSLLHSLFLNLLLACLVGPTPLIAAKPHVISFRSPGLYPPDLAYDLSSHHFLVGSLRHRTISSVSHTGAVETLISDPSLPENASILGMAVDSANHRLLAVINTMAPLPPFSALGAYDLRSPDRRRLFLSLLQDEGGPRPIANDVAVDSDGNAYVTNSAGNFIWKVNAQGEPSIFSKSPAFTHYPIDNGSPFSFCGLNGIAYVNEGYLLVVQSNTGKMFKVDAADGTARTVALTEDLPLADAVAVRHDGVVLVVSQSKLWFLKSGDSWGKGVPYDEIALDEEAFPTSVAEGREGRTYVLYSGVWEGIVGNGKREWFRIEEVESMKEGKEGSVWVFVLAGLGLAALLFWRHLRNMHKKTH